MKAQPLIPFEVNSSQCKQQPVARHALRPDFARLSKLRLLSKVILFCVCLSSHPASAQIFSDALWFDDSNQVLTVRNDAGDILATGSSTEPLTLNYNVGRTMTVHGTYSLIAPGTGETVSELVFISNTSPIWTIKFYSHPDPPIVVENPDVFNSEQWSPGGWHQWPWHVLGPPVDLVIFMRSDGMVPVPEPVSYASIAGAALILAILFRRKQVQRGR